MAETFTLDDFQDTKQQAPLSFDESDFQTATEKPASNADYLKAKIAQQATEKPLPTPGLAGQVLQGLTSPIAPEGESWTPAGELKEIGSRIQKPYPGIKPIAPKESEPTDSAATAVGKEAYNLAISIPNFIATPAGFATTMMGGTGGTIAKAIPALFSAQAWQQVGSTLLNLIPNWAKLSTPEKAKALTDVGGNALFGALMTKGGTPKVEPFTEPPYSGRVLESKQPAGAVPPQPKEANASNIETPTEIHGDVRTQPVSGEGELPIEESGGGVQPQAAGRLPETPANAPEQPPLEVPKVEGGLAPAEKFKKIGDDLGFTYDADFGLGEKKLHQFTFRNLPKDDPAYGASFYAPVGATAEEVTALANKKAAQFRDAAEPPQVPVETPPAPAGSSAPIPEEGGELPVSDNVQKLRDKLLAAPTKDSLLNLMADNNAFIETVQPHEKSWLAEAADIRGNELTKAEKGAKPAAPSQPPLAQAKEPWEMTQDDYFDSVISSSKQPDAISADHKASVENAIKQGKPVPPEVLADYPDLVKPAAPAQEGKLPKQMFARIKGTTQTFPVESLDDAARKYSLMRVKSNAGASQLPPVDLLDEKGKQFARISYNGKVWDMGGKLLYDPFAKQIEPPSPSVVKPSAAPAAETGKAIADFASKWNKDHPELSYERAVELEGHEYPRIDAAYFNFDKLTPEEQQLTIKRAEDDLESQKQEVKSQYQSGKKSVAAFKGTDFQGRGMQRHKESLRVQKLFEERLARLKKQAKPSAQPVAPTEKVSEQSPEQVLENHPNVKVTLPKSATMVRVTDAKGNQYVTSKKEIESGNVYHGAGVKKVEAGTIGKDKKFIPGKEPVTIEAKPKLVGMGAALAGETAPNPNSPTSIKNAQVDIERAKRGLPPAMQPQRRAFGQVWDEAMAAVDHDPVITARPGITDRLVDELKNHPRSVSDFEDALLLHKQIELQNDYGTLTRDLAQAYEDAKEFPNRQEQVDELSVRVAGLSDRMQELYDINKKAGTETARGLNARKMMAYEDYSLAAMELQKRAANQGRPLSDTERIELQKAHDKIAELQKQYDDLVAKNAEKQTVPEIENVLKVTKARTPRGSTEELAGFDKTKEKIGAALEKGDRSSINGLVQKLVRAFVEENPAIQRDELVDKVHGVLREFDPEFSRRDTMDAISGYGDFKPLRKDLISNTVRDLKGQLQQIGKLEDMAAGEAPKKTGVERRTPSDEERRLIKQVEEAKRKGGYKVTDPAAQLRTALQAVKTRLENQIKDLEFQLQRRQKIVRTRTPIALDAAAESLKARRDELKSQYDAMFPREPISDAQRLANWKTRTQNRIATLQDKLANGDFAKRPVRPPPELDAGAQKIQTELFRAKQNFQRALIEDRLRQRPMWIKAQDTFLRWYRGGLLSSPVVFAKLTAAAIVRAGLTPVEEVVGGAISKALPKLAARAPREGYWNSEAEAKAITSHLTKGRLDAWDVLTKGETELDILYGKGREGALGENQVRPFSVADIPGRAHGAFKASTKRAEFERSLTKRLAYEIRNGADGSSPAVQLRSAIEAYKDANRSIFLQDNRVVSAWQAAIRRVEQASKLTGQPSPGGKTVGTIMRTAVPIVRVPSNIVAEALQFATGSVTGSARLGLALRQGIDTLPPEQADLIMRELKKGSLGGAVLITGFLLPHIWGGFYQANQKKKPGQIANNAARIGGVNIPASALHNPIFEVAQAGATARMIADKNQAAGALAIPMGAKAASLGLIEETPFIREMLEAGRAFNPNEQNAYFGELAKSMTVPQLLQWMATRGDVDVAGNPITRKPKTFMQHIEAGIPGLRENVPSKGAAANWAAP